MNCYPRLVTALLVALSSASAVAQTQPPVPSAPRPAATPAGPGTTVMGVVRDSLSGRILRGALVQLVGEEGSNVAARTATSDSAGGYSFDAVPDGKYTLGFFHPKLDSLGLPALARSVSVNRQGALRMDLAIPGARRMRDVVCGPKTAESSGAAVIGYVLDASTRAPLKDVRVSGQWNEVTFIRGTVVQRSPRRTATSDENGRYVLCDVPGPGSVSLMAVRGADSTDLVELEVPADGFAQRELFVGTSQVTANADTISAKDTLAFRNATVRVGDKRLTGTVVALEGGLPVAGAVVGVLNGPQTRANDRGQWTLTNVAPGSRTIEVRAVGRVPVRRNVDVLDATPPVRIAMSTYKAMLDTLKVTAGLSASLDIVEFEHRKKTSGVGRFMSAADIARHAPLETTDIFRNFPGLEIRREGPSDTLLMKAVIGETCAPRVFFNGTPMDGLSVDMINNLTRPERIIGIEVYQTGMVPVQFQGPMSGCGSVVIWARN